MPQGAIYCDYMQDYDRAIDDFENAIEADAKYVSAYGNLGIAKRRKGLLESALLDFTEAIKLDPKNAEHYRQRTAVYEAQNEGNKAIADYRKVLELAPSDSDTLNRLAWALARAPDARLQNADLALELARKAVRLRPKDADVHNTLGVAQYRTGNWAAAIDALQEGAELRSTPNAVDWLFLAMAHWQLGHKENARSWYDKAVAWTEKNQPEDDELRHFRAEVEALTGLSEVPAAEAESKERPTRSGQPTEGGENSRETEPVKELTK